MNRLLIPALSLLALFVVVANLTAAPTIQNLSLRGLQIGQTTALTIDGADLLDGSQLLIDVPLADQTVQQATGNRLLVEVTVDASARPGIYALRIANAKGVSNAVAIGVDALPQQPFGERIENRPLALHGAITGGQTLRTGFAGKQGERVVVDVESRRLGASLRPVVRLYDPRGTQITWSSRRREIGDDARLEAILPVDGDYLIELHDVLFRGAAPGFFRMKIGDLRTADFAMPLAVTQGEQTAVALEPPISGDPVSTTFDAATAIPGHAAVSLPANSDHWTGGQPRLLVSDIPELVEQVDEEGPRRLPAAPVAVTGRLATAGEEDQYQLPVTPGSKLRFEVWADRFGSALDGVLMVRNANGGQLARGDDQPGTADPMVEYTVPNNVEQVIVAVRDLVNRGGERFYYRLVVRDANRPDFALTMDADRINVPAGGSQVLRIDAQRKGYNGPIELAVEGLPSDIQVAGNWIPAGQNVALVSLTAPESVPVHGIARVIGRAANGVDLVRPALAAEQAYTKHHPWMRSELAHAITEPAPLGIVWSNASDDDRLPLGGSLLVKAQVTRTGQLEGKIRIRSLTTQIPPKKTVKQNNMDVEVDDVERTVRLETEPILDASTTETDVNIIVPADLPQATWGVVLVAELLSADEKNVIFSTTTPVRQLESTVPFSIQVTGSDRVEAKAGVGDTGQLKGTLVRATGFAQPVAVALAGLPKDYPAPRTIVEADESEFTLPVRFPYGTTAAELTDVKLVAIYTPDVNQPNLQVTSEEVTLAAITIVPGEKREAEMPLVVFEDDAEFLSLLTKGEGNISLDEKDKYSGSAAIRVTPPQRYEESVSTLSVKIRENPGPGEYRYLRFAWKKRGGASICLQLSHDGQWGPSDGARPGAKFRYHAGSGGECFGASLMIDEKLPADFVVVTRDLYEDFGEFTLTGLGLAPVDGEYALFDHILLGRDPADFELVKP